MYAFRENIQGQRNEVAAGLFAQNPLVDMFAKPQRETQFDSRRELFTQYEDYADAFVNNPIVMARTYDGLLMSTTSSYLTTKIMPKLYTKQTDVTWEKLIFDKTILPEVASEAPGRYLHHRSERGYAKTKRRGQAIHLEYEFQKTPQGREMLAMQLVQLNNNALITANMLVMARLCNIHQNDKKYKEQYAKEGVSAMSLVEESLTNFCIVSKLGAEGLKNIINSIEVINKYKNRLPLNAIILPTKLKYYVTNVFPEETRGIFPGEQDLPINNNQADGAFGMVGTLPAFEAPDYSEITQTSELNPMDGLVMIGGFIPILSEGMPLPADAVARTEYVAKRTVKVFNETAGCDFPLTLDNHVQGALWETYFQVPAPDIQSINRLRVVPVPAAGGVAAVGVADADLTPNDLRVLERYTFVLRIFARVTKEEYETDKLAGVGAVRARFRANSEANGPIPGINWNDNANAVRTALRGDVTKKARLSFIDFRTCQKYKTLRGIACRGGPELGRLMIGPTDFEWSRDGTIKTIHGLFTIWINAILIDDSNAYILENLMYADCLKGSDTEFFDNADMKKLRDNEYLFTNLPLNDPCYRKSIMCFPIPFDTEFWELPKILDITGRFNDSFNAKKKFNEINKTDMGYYPGAEFNSEYMMKDVMPRSHMGMEFVPRIPNFNTICPREGFKRCTDVAKREFNDVEVNKNAHGPDVRPGCEMVRKGAAAPIQYQNVRQIN